VGLIIAQVQTYSDSLLLSGESGSSEFPRCATAYSSRTSMLSTDPSPAAMCIASNSVSVLFGFLYPALARTSAPFSRRHLRTSAPSKPLLAKRASAKWTRVDRDREWFL